MITVFGSLVALTVALESPRLSRDSIRMRRPTTVKSFSLNRALVHRNCVYSIPDRGPRLYAELSLIVIGAPGFDDVFRLGIIFIWVNGLFYLLKNRLRFGSVAGPIHC